MSQQQQQQQQTRSQQQLLRRGFEIYQQVPRSDRDSIADLVEWFREHTRTRVMDHEAFDKCMSDFVATNKLAFDANDLRECVEGSMSIPFLRTLNTIFDKWPQRTPILKNFNYQLGNNIINDVVDGYYNAQSAKVRKSYVEILRDLMRHGVDVIYGPMPTRMRQQSLDTYRIKHMVQSPLMCIAVGERYDFLHTFAELLSSPELQAMDTGLQFMIRNFTKAPGIDEYCSFFRCSLEDVKERLTHASKLIVRILIPRVFYLWKKRSSQPHRRLSATTTKVQHPHAPFQQTWSFEQYLAGERPTDQRKEEWDLLRHIPVHDRHNVSSIIDYVQQHISQKWIVSVRVLDAMLSHLVRKNLLVDATTTLKDIDKCLNGIYNTPFLRTLESILQTRHVPSQLFLESFLAGREDFSYSVKNYSAKCADGYMNTGLKSIRKKYIKCLLTLMRAGIIKLAFPFDATNLNQSQINNKKILFLSSSFLFRIAMWEYWDFLQDLAHELTDEELTQAFQDMQFIKTHAGGRRSLEMSHYMQDNHVRHEEILSSLEHALGILKKVKKQRQRGSSSTAI